MSNTNIGNNAGIIGDGTIIVFNIQAPITRGQVEKEFQKLNSGDLQDITGEVDEGLREKHIVIWSYTKNCWLQLKQQRVSDDFNEPWLPTVPADMGKREKKPYLKLTPVYQGVVFPFSYSFIEMDGGRYVIPLPKVEYNRAGEEIDRNNPVKKCTITRVQYQLGKILTGDAPNNASYDDLLKESKIEVVDEQ
jgi:hypothetical protein